MPSKLGGWVDRVDMLDAEAVLFVDRAECPEMREERKIGKSAKS